MDWEWALILIATISIAVLFIEPAFSSKRGRLREVHQISGFQPPKAWIEKSPGLKEVLQPFYEGKVGVSDALRQFGEFLPKHLEKIALEQGRSISDVMLDVVQLSEVNISGVQELATEQVHFPDLKEVWVFATRPVDLHANFYSTVRKNIVERFVEYYYFQSDEKFFNELRDRLNRDIGKTIEVNQYLHCILLPAVAFLAPGFGLLITNDPRHIKGKYVTKRAEDGTVIQAQDMTPFQVREAYLQLRPIVEKNFNRILPVLEGEKPYDMESYNQVLAYSSKLQ